MTIGHVHETGLYLERGMGGIPPKFTTCLPNFLNIRDRFPTYLTTFYTAFVLNTPFWVDRALISKILRGISLLKSETYRKISNISRTKSQNLNFSRIGLQLPLRIYWSHVLSGEWRCSWSSADRRCSNYIWVINNLIAYESVPYIRDLTVDTTLIKQIDHPGLLHIVTRTKWWLFCRHFQLHFIARWFLYFH